MFVSIHGTITARETLQQVWEELGMKLDSRTFVVSIDDEGVDETAINAIIYELEETYDYLEEQFLASVRSIGQKHQVKLVAAMTD